MGFADFPPLFLQASISAMLTASVAWCILQLIQRRWRSVTALRTPWLLAQLAGATTLVLVALPAASHLSLFSIEATPGVAGLAMHWPAGEIRELVGKGVDDLASDTRLQALAWAWLVAYIAGAGWCALRWQRSHCNLQTLMSVAERLDLQALHAHPGFARHHGAAVSVLEVDAPVSPLLAGLIRPVLLLPSHMRDLPSIQQQLIVAHELMHLCRRDHLWQHTGRLLQVLLWFIPAVHSFNRSLQWAVEIGCDRAVLVGRSDSERRSYAAALLAQLAVQSRMDGVSHGASTALGFGFHGVHSLAERMRLIRDAQSLSRAGIASTTALLMLPALCSASVLLQPQFAWNGPVKTSSPLVHLDHLGSASEKFAGTSLQAPLAQLHVTSSFGSINRPGGKPHKGTDFRAPHGTAVLSPANGKVVVSTDRHEGDTRYGNVVVIEHDDGTRTLYAHLDRRTVRMGDTVRAGQQIARSGATGKASGPHLHFEVSRQGMHIDPQTVLEGVQSPPGQRR